MPLRRLVATFVVACLAVLAGCDDGPPPATVGNPDAGAAEPDSRFPTYVALGDSYTAAPGVQVTEQESGCLRSNGNYATLVAGLLKAKFVDVSCSGASTLSLVGSQRTSEHVYPPQFQALSPDTSLVTLGIGGNDLELFNTLISVCAQLGLSEPDAAPCRDYMKENGEKSDLLLEKIDKITTRVTSALKGIHDRSPQATVVLVGYPQPVPAKGQCKILPLAKGDYPYVRKIVAALGAGMEKAARKGDAIYVDMLGPSKGHDICAGQDAWVNGIATDVNRALAFHPFGEEQHAVADLILEQLEALP